MHVFTKRFGVVTGFALMLLLLLANGLVLRRQLAKQVAIQTWVAHTRQVMQELAETESLLKGAETGQRGFLYTGDEKYLAPYKNATREIGQHLDDLQRLTADNSVQQARVAALRELSGEKLRELAHTISLFRSGDAAEARAIVLSDSGLLIMNDIHRNISEMGAEEDRLESLRSISYRESIR